ncbi:leucyl/phenylalanyl-tRNA--protein transferase [Thiomicrorhabdus xiamenensis]|uniref:Leucyl/phenylalanyl-tRNA--protein transferase n=1 Tax=Thiomicrorhabdus xiamenensis TaxID=2739063 RepID=A0A7D4TFT3_9GAMM|nr:leucyl/phenylalanyl-tRNA--protein transferase [Thiomicrorhabdus xiamenensis]QKI89088.1 leucyl/phenylalanyl-tRNA--protein transferase [Thiomicrorhabdus xiamenensis]
MNDSIEIGQAPFWLSPENIAFPPSELALDEPDGLLAIGGDLTPQWLLHAYKNGIFPWFNADDPILWWTPNPRSVLKIKNLKISRSLRKSWRDKVLSGKYKITLDTAFQSVMHNCASIPRKDQDGTWINHKMISSYLQLHLHGYAHSVEVWDGDQLIGGLYGLAIGKIFFGESMFAHKTDASKLALIAICFQLEEWGFEWIDTQVETSHLSSMGATLLARDAFEVGLRYFTRQPFPPKSWDFELDWPSVLDAFRNRHSDA